MRPELCRWQCAIVLLAPNVYGVRLLAVVEGRVLGELLFHPNDLDRILPSLKTLGEKARMYNAP